MGAEVNYHTDSALVEKTEIVMHSLYNWLAVAADHINPPPRYGD